MNKIFLIITISFFLISFGNQAYSQSDEKLAILETNLGNIIIEFFPDDAPNHVNNFIKLSESGFYDGTIFHRIIPNFMIQGGDPNTVSGDPNTWGQGGPTERVDAEFNTIKHNRGIVSMARSQDPNSAGSQFFIVHQNSNTLDGQYSIFGRIVTEESFDTIDKIAVVETGPRDVPIDIEQVKLTKVIIVDRSEVSNLLTLSEPERTESSITTPTGNQKFESEEYEITFSAPEGWLLQQPAKTQENSPDVVAVGPKVGMINPVISLTIKQINEQTFDEIISEHNESLTPVIESGDLIIISQEKINVNNTQAYETNASGLFSSNGEQFNVKFREVMIYGTEEFYIFAYSNGADDFNVQLPKFEESIISFETSEPELIDEQPKENGSCLIATAAYGTELAPQVQFLREIRDNTVLSTASGAAFMTGFNTLYYSFAPTIADMERENPMFQDAVRAFITPMISTLSIMSLADEGSEVEVLGLGISVIALNLGMYIAAPTIIIYKIRKITN